MEGYVEVVFTEDEADVIRKLAKEVDQYYSLPKEDQFAYTTKEHKFIWWKYTSKQLVPDAPNELSPFFSHPIFDEDSYGCDLSYRGEMLISLAKLVRNNRTVYLGEELCGIVNFLRNREYI